MILTTERETVRLRRELLAHPFANDNWRVEQLERIWDLESTTPLSKSLARRDLNEAAFNHTQPCRCPRCRL